MNLPHRPSSRVIRKNTGEPNRKPNFDYQKLEDRIVLTAGNGLLGQYYNDANLSEIAMARVDTNVDFDWGAGSYETGGPANSFSVRWSGQLESQFTETHSLILNANDGARLWVNGQLLIDQFDSGSVSDATAAISLVAGRRYDIQLEYRETTGDASVKLEWESVSLSREVIPSERLYASERGSIAIETWTGIAGGDVADLTSDANFPSNPDSVSNLPSFETLTNVGDNLGQKISGLLSPPTTGPYTFFIAGDESAELWISNSSNSNQKQLISSVTTATAPRDWTASASQKSQPVYLAAGQQYYIEALHKEATGADHLAVGWIKPGDSNVEVISGEFLAQQVSTVRIYSDRPSVAEGSPQPGSFTIVRSGGPTNNPLVVNYNVSGDATSGVDYTALSGSITIPAGQDSVALTIDVIADSNVEGDESIVVEIKNDVGYEVGFKSERTAYGTIQDDVASPAGGNSLVSGTDLSDFSHFGGTYSTVSDPVEGDVIQAVIGGGNSNPWNAQLKQGIAGPVTAGDVLLIEFKVRSVGGDGQIAAIFEKNITPFTKSLLQGLPTSDDWMKVQIPFLAAETYAAGEASFGFFLAYGAQTVRLTDFVVVNYGPQRSLAPETAFNLNNISGTHGTSQYVTVANQPFEIAFEVETTSVPDQFWHIQAVERNESAVPNGDTMRFEFSLRATQGTNARANFSVQRTDTYANLHSQTIDLTTEWQNFSIDVLADDDFPIDGLQAVFNLGYELQTVQIGGFHWTNEANLFNLDELPEQFPAATYEGRDGTDSWRGTADDRIDSDRKSNVNVSVNDVNGNPLSGAVVSLRQTNHDFKFGSAINAYGGKLDANGNETSQKYQALINRLFNTVVFENSLKWPGYSQDAQRAIDGVNWADSNDLYIRGHNLIWPSRNFMPTSIWAEYDTRVANDGTASANAWMKTTIETHFDDVLNQFDGLIPEWDVVNEPYANHDVMDILGDQILLDWFQRVRDFDPTIKLALNDYHIFSSNGANTDHRANFDDWLGQLRDLGLLDVIGEQSHYNEANLTNIETLGQLVTSYNSEFAAPIAITEFDVNTKDEQLQADYLRDYMTMAFSQSAVEEFLHWGFWENSHWLPDAALYRSDFSIKPNGQAYEDLVFGSWWTDEQATTRDGAITTNAFLGEYDVIVEYNGQTYSSTVTVDATGNSSVTVDLPVETINYEPIVVATNAIVTGEAASMLTNDGIWFEPENEVVTLTASLGQVTKNSDGTWSWSFVPEQRYENQPVSITATDARGATSDALFAINAETNITIRGVSYGGSSGFGDNEIATNKTPLLPGETSSFDNFTSYNRGLNRVIVDVAGLASSSLTVDDFEFRVGNTDTPSAWDVLSATSEIPLPSIEVSSPVGGISQIKLSWPDNVIENAWLRVTIKANENTGLVADDRFFFGNQIAEVIGDVNTANNRIRVNSIDAIRVRLNVAPVTDVPIDNLYDVDRNGRVNSLDTVRVRLNLTTGGLLMFTAPVGGGFAFGSSAGTEGQFGGSSDSDSENGNTGPRDEFSSVSVLPVPSSPTGSSGAGDNVADSNTASDSAVESNPSEASVPETSDPVSVSKPSFVDNLNPQDSSGAASQDHQVNNVEVQPVDQSLVIPSIQESLTTESDLENIAVESNDGSESYDDQVIANDEEDEEIEEQNLASSNEPVATFQSNGSTTVGINLNSLVQASIVPLKTGVPNAGLEFFANSSLLLPVVHLDNEKRVANHEVLTRRTSAKSDPDVEPILNANFLRTGFVSMLGKNTENENSAKSRAMTTEPELDLESGTGENQSDELSNAMHFPKAKVQTKDAKIQNKIDAVFETFDVLTKNPRGKFKNSPMNRD
ncbi:MAG: endo-1,4-beta-xylanase [Mariniblastus sp.]